MPFIRQGGWCECERSCNCDLGKFEKGVSVYECKQVGGRWQCTGPAWNKNKSGVIKSLS